MAELDEAIEAAAAELWHDANPGMPIRDCNAWQECMGIARRAVGKAAELIVAATRRQVAEELAAKVEALYGPGADDTYFALMDHLKAIARGRGETDTKEQK